MSDYTDMREGDPYNWPLAKFFFRVTIDGLPELGFQTVEGLEAEMSVIEYRPGNSQYLFKSKRPGLVTYSNITLKKGAFEGDYNLLEFWRMYGWLAETEYRNNKKEIMIELMDDGGTPIITWTCKGCFPVKFTPPSMDAEADSEPAVEEMEIAVESWDIDWV